MKKETYICLNHELGRTDSILYFILSSREKYFSEASLRLTSPFNTHHHYFPSAIRQSVNVAFSSNFSYFHSIKQVSKFLGFTHAITFPTRSESFGVYLYNKPTNHSCKSNVTTNSYSPRSYLFFTYESGKLIHITSNMAIFTRSLLLVDLKICYNSRLCQFLLTFVGCFDICGKGYRTNLEL
jgi:hypothetical protein